MLVSSTAPPAAMSPRPQWGGPAPPPAVARAAAAAELAKPIGVGMLLAPAGRCVTMETALLVSPAASARTKLMVIDWLEPKAVQILSAIEPPKPVPVLTQAVSTKLPALPDENA